MKQKKQELNEERLNALFDDYANQLANLNNWISLLKSIRKTNMTDLDLVTKLAIDHVIYVLETTNNSLCQIERSLFDEMMI